MTMRLLVASLLSAFMMTGSLSAKTWHVPSEVTSATEAAFLASEGDTVSLAPGVYNERFTVIGKNLVLVGDKDNPASTIIDGSIGNPGGPTVKGNVITVEGVTRDFVIEGLTIRGGEFNVAAIESLGAGIYVNQAHPTIRHCILRENHAVTGGGIAAYFFSRPRVEHCIVTQNDGGGIFIETGDGLQSGPRAEIYNTTIVRNIGYGISTIKGARTDIQKSTIAFNNGDGIRTEIGNARIWVSNSLVVGNGGGGIYRRDPFACLELSCNDVWDNTAGNWLGTNPSDSCYPGRGSGSVSIDPSFVDAENEDYTLESDSPLFGACAEGSCGAMGANIECPTAVERATWGELKALFGKP